jgi:hypothetical protein
VTTRRVQASALASWLTERFPSESWDKLDFGGPHIFEVCISPRLNFFGIEYFLEAVFSSFLKILPFEQLSPHVLELLEFFE